MSIAATDTSLATGTPTTNDPNNANSESVTLATETVLTTASIIDASVTISDASSNMDISSILCDVNSELGMQKKILDTFIQWDQLLGQLDPWLNAIVNNS